MTGDRSSIILKFYEKNVWSRWWEGALKKVMFSWVISKI